VASKDAAGGSLYRAPAPLRADQVNVLRRVARVPPVVTDGAFLPDGRGFVLRDYQGAFLYRAPGRRAGAFELPLQLQGESITATADGRAVLAGSEGPASEVWRVPVPDALLAKVTPATKAPSGAAPAPAGSPAAGGGWNWAPLLAAAGGLVLLGAAVLLWVAGRRRGR
jgi:hypothetical protein